MRNFDDAEEKENTVRILLSSLLKFLFKHFLQSGMKKDEADINQTSFPALFGTEFKIWKSFNNHYDEIIFESEFDIWD